MEEHKHPEILEQITFRQPTEADLPFIFSSWLKSFRNSNFAKNILNNTYYSEHHRIIEEILKISTVLLACDKSNVENIYGYIVAAKLDNMFTIHYVYVKHTYRRMGLAGLLIGAFQLDPREPAYYTHDTHMANILARKYRFEYNPYLLSVRIENNEVQS